MVLALVGRLSFLGNPSAVQADPYLRVRKNGVIYYYFSDKEDNSSSQSLRTLSENSG